MRSTRNKRPQPEPRKRISESGHAAGTGQPGRGPQGEKPLTPLTFVPGTIDMSKLPEGILLAPQYTPPQQQELLMVPGDDGGCEGIAQAFSPRTNFVYYGTRYEPTTFQTSPNNPACSGGVCLGSTFEEVIPGVSDFGIFGATDTTTGRWLGRFKWTSPQNPAC